MKLGIIISQTDPETLFNVLRLANFAINKGDRVELFLLGKGVELDQLEEGPFKVRQQAKSFLELGGTIRACGTCLKLRNSEGSEICPLSTMEDLYTLIKSTDRLVSF